MTLSIRALTTGVAFVLSVGLLAPVASADSTATHWRVTVGAQSPDMGIQISTYFPNDITIDAGDSVTWTSQTAEPHTITFLAVGQTAPQDPFSPPAGGNMYSGSGYFNSGPMMGEPAPGFVQSYTLTFNQPGTYTYVCLFHPFMTGTVHVQAAGAA